MIWHRQFFEEPQTNAEFAYWAKMPDWSVEEIAALSLGKDPRFVSSKKFVHGTRGTEFSAIYRSQLKLAQSHRASGRLGRRTCPVQVIEWAEAYDFLLPNDLVDLVRKLEARRTKKRELLQQVLTISAPEQSPHEVDALQSSEPLPDKQSAEPTAEALEIDFAASENPEKIRLTSQAKRQLANLRALLAAMAISKYNYNPEVKSEVPEILANLLDKKGVQLGAETIRIHLKAGSNLLLKARAKNDR